jgi:hypothetical protein
MLKCRGETDPKFVADTGFHCSNTSATLALYIAINQ